MRGDRGNVADDRSERHHELLPAQPGSWTAGTKFTYQWFADGKAIKGATKRVFTPTSRQKGKRITVRVIGSKTGFRKAGKLSAPTAKVAAVAKVKKTAR